MPEARDRLPGAGTVDMALGFGIRRGVYAESAQSRSSHEQTMFRSPLSDNKENIPPESSTSRRRRSRTRPRKSPLPSWYPRTPLRDITAVVTAVERRRSRIRVAAELRRRHQESAISSPFPLLTSPLAHASNDSEQPPPPIQEQESSLGVSNLSPDPSAAIRNNLQPAEHPPESSSPSSHGKRTVVTDKSSDSIDEIGRIVMENFNKMARSTAKKTKTSTLMSMR